MLATGTLEQLYEWFDYFALEPFGEERADLRAGIIAATMANAWRGKGSRTYKPQDFMPRFDRQPRVQNVKEMQNVFRQYAKAVRIANLKKRRNA